MRHLSVVIFLMVLISCSQSKKVATPATTPDQPLPQDLPSKSKSESNMIQSAFLTVTSPGAQQVDENGQAVDNFMVDRNIFLEWASADVPKFILVTAPNGLKFKGEAAKVKVSGIEVGETNSSNEKITLKAKSSHTLWQIKLSPLDFVKQPIEPFEYLDVRATFGNAPFATRIAAEVLLKAEQRY